MTGLPVYFQDKQYPYTCNNDSKMAIFAKNINFLKWPNWNEMIFTI